MRNGALKAKNRINFSGVMFIQPTNKGIYSILAVKCNQLKPQDP